jgi:hypothetical protein
MTKLSFVPTTRHFLLDMATTAAIDDPEGWSDYDDDVDDTMPSEYTLVCRQHWSDDDDEKGSGYTGQIDDEPNELAGPKDGADEHKADGATSLSYQSVADQLLQGLERDYLMTLHAPRQLQREREVSQEDHEFAASLFSMIASVHDDLVDTESFAATFPQDTLVNAVDQVDTEAVRRVVANMSGESNHPLNVKLRQWQLDQCSLFVPRTHSLIPSSFLHFFRNPHSSLEAREATHQLSRSATLAQALVRFDLLQSQPALTIHILGGDATVECASIDTVRQVYSPLIQWIGAHVECPESVRLVVVGPDVPAAMTTSPVTLDTASDEASSAATRNRLQQATVHCYSALYHDWIQAGQPQARPDLVVAFHAGMWGYDSWLPTLRYLAAPRHGGDEEHAIATTTTGTDLWAELNMLPLLVTSYTIEEALDDYDVIRTTMTTESGSLCKCCWEPELNPFGSRLPRVTETALPGRDYRENSAWQAWRLPR